MKYAGEFREHFGKRKIFTSRDVSLYFAKLGISNGYRDVLLHNLAKKGELKKIKKGTYTFSSEITCAGFAYSPFYYGLQDALSMHNLWEQETNPIVITPQRARQGMRSFEGNNYLVRRISRSMFFGFSQVKYGGSFVPVSDVEKTLIDFFYFKEPLSKEALMEIKARMDKKVLEDYLKRCPKRLGKIVRKAIGDA